MLQGARILITGVTGQVGNGVAAVLAPHNDLIGLARFTAAGSRERVEAMGVKAVVCDLSAGDFSGVPDDIDYVLHMAANLKPATFEQGIRDNADATALLMAHCQRAKAFLYTSTIGVYDDHPDPAHAFVETDPARALTAGGSGATNANYAPTKLAGELAVRSVGLALGLPSIVVRLGTVYGRSRRGVLPSILDALMKGRAVPMPADGPMLLTQIHEDDIARFLEPLFVHAAIPAPVCNLGGDEIANSREAISYLAGLVGAEPNFLPIQGLRRGFVLDKTLRRALTGPCTIPWREGYRDMVATSYPDLPLPPAS